MIVSAQISIYPLRQESLSPAIALVQETLQGHGLSPQMGPMSTIVTGDAPVLFAALGDTFDKAAETGQVVMTVTVSNACPVGR